MTNLHIAFSPIKLFILCHYRIISFADQYGYNVPLLCLIEEDLV